MLAITITTLVDITKTNISRSNQGPQHQIDQQKNFTTLQQCLELRSIIEFIGSPSCGEADIDGLGFGSAYAGPHKVWTVTFETDRGDVYTDQSGDKIGLLINDIHSVPIITNLDETINIIKAVFDCRDPVSCNTVVRVVRSN